MASLSFTNFFIFFSITLFSISNANSPPPYEFVRKVCSKLDDHDVCLQILEFDDRSKFAENITTLTTIAVDATIKDAKAIRNMLRGLKTGRAGVLKSLKGCIHHVISNLKISKSTEDCSLIGYHFHIAAEMAKRCQRIVDSNAAHGSFITTGNEATVDMCWLGESLANLMCKS